MTPAVCRSSLSPALRQKIPRGSFSPPRIIIQSGRNKPSQIQTNDEALENVNGGAARTVRNDSRDYANVREYPGLDTAVCGRVYNGETVYTTGETCYADGYNWYKIVLPSGSDEAWIAGSLIGY